jgi:dihydrofolate reductase
MPETTTMPPSPPHLTLIVAATPKNGIGKNGALPWPMLKKEMAYFARVTKRVPKSAESASDSDSDSDPTTRQNAVLMGRKTYLSIPPKFRPLKGRTNIVISSQPRSAVPDITDKEDVIVSSSIMSALRDLEAGVEAGRVPEVGRVFVIGGARVYGDALGLECARSVLLTRLREEFECDTFFPELDGWVKRERRELEDFVGEEVQEGGLVEEGVGYEFQLWEREG